MQVIRIEQKLAMVLIAAVAMMLTIIFVIGIKLGDKTATSRIIKPYEHKTSIGTIIFVVPDGWHGFEMLNERNKVYRTDEQIHG